MHKCFGGDRIPNEVVQDCHRESIHLLKSLLPLQYSCNKQTDKCLAELSLCIDCRMYFSLLAFTTTAAESETINPAKVLSPVPSSGSFISKQLYMKRNHSDDLTEQIKAVVDILLETIAASSKRK